MGNVFEGAKVGDKFKRIKPASKYDIEVGDIFTYRGRGEYMVSDRNGAEIGTAFENAWEKYYEKDAVNAKIEALEREIAALKELVVVTKSNNRREEVIAKAVADVAQLSSTLANSINKREGNARYREYRNMIEFHVNKKKGAVTALLRGFYLNEVHEKGFAKCSKDDEFSEEIGKAIAMRRACGLPVPSEYLTL